MGWRRRSTASGFQLRLFDITSDVGVPVMFAIIAPKLDGHEQHWKHFDISGGMGLPSLARPAPQSAPSPRRRRAA